MAKFKLRLLIPLFTALLFGCDGNVKADVQPSEHDIFVNQQVDKLKNDVEHRFVYYVSDGYYSNLYMKDITNGCVYVNFGNQYRSGLTLLQGTCKK